MGRVKSSDIAALRRFTRFYTRQTELLNDGLLRSPFSLAEARVLYEISTRDGARASDVGRDLGLDAGYLSRILSTLDGKGLIERNRSDADRRAWALRLTPAGREAFGPLDVASNKQAAMLLRPLSPGRREALVAAMREIEAALGAKPEADAAWMLRPPRVGDMGWIVHRQGVLYHREYGWDATFEALVAEIAAAFVRSFDPAREGCWIAERQDKILGSVFLVRQSDDVAKLRLLYVEPEARGLGVGRRLVAECIRFAREAGYRALTLWTNDILVSARRIYEAAGFRLVAEERHHSFGHDLVGQNWDLAL